MAGGGWFHASVKSISRSTGRSAVAAAAYRAAAVMRDERTGLQHDYSRKAGVVWSGVILPENAPADFTDPAHLWNAAEQSENRKNSVTARELQLALPAELDDERRRAVAEAVARFLVERYGVAVHAAIHRPDRKGDERNHHAHILFTTRRVGPDGLTEKTRELDAKATRSAEVEAIRQAAAAAINRELERAGSPERVDHRSYERQGIEQEPTTHLGPSASAMERNGEGSDRGDRNRETEAANRERDELREQAKVIDLELERERRRLALIEQQRRAADLKAHGKAQLTARHEAQRKALHEAKERRIAQARATIKERHRHVWASLFQEQKRERRELEQAQRGALARLGLWLHDRRAGRLADGERGVLAGAFRALIGRDAALERLQERHDRQRAELGAKIGERTRAALAPIKAEHRAELDELRRVQRQEAREAEREPERATGTDGPTVTAPEPQPETEAQAETRRAADRATVEADRARLRGGERDRGMEPER